MKISEAMVLCDRLTGNPSDGDLKIIWLERIEGIIYDEIISTHENSPERPPSCANGERELLACDPYSELYPLYMSMQNDLLLRDTVSYINSAAAFATAYTAFADMYNRTHTPLAAVSEIKV